MKMGTKHQSKKYSKEEVFNLYFAMGINRNLTVLAKETGLLLSKLYRWSRKNNWQDRIVEKDREVTDKVLEETQLSAAILKQKYLKATDTLIDKFIERIDNKLISMEVADFAKMVTQSLLLLGEDTERTGGDITIHIKEVIERAKKPGDEEVLENVDEELKDLMEVD